MNYTYGEEEGGKGTGESYTIYKVKKGKLEDGKSKWPFHVTVAIDKPNNKDTWKRDHITFEDESNIKWFFFYDANTEQWQAKDQYGNSITFSSTDESDLFDKVLADMEEAGIKLNGIEVKLT